MKRLTIAVLSVVSCALAVSAIALPSLGRSPVPPAAAVVAGPTEAQLRMQATANEWAALRNQALQSLQSLGDRDLNRAREQLSALQASWRNSDSSAQLIQSQKSQRVELLIQRAVAQLNQPGADVILGKAAVLNVLSAIDAPEQSSRQGSGAAASTGQRAG